MSTRLTTTAHRRTCCIIKRLCSRTAFAYRVEFKCFQHCQVYIRRQKFPHLRFAKSYNSSRMSCGQSVCCLLGLSSLIHDAINVKECSHR